MEIATALAGEPLLPETDRLAQELHRRIVNSLGDIHLTHYFITQTIPQYHLTPAQAWLVTIARDLAFTLTNQHGRIVHADDYAGKVVMLFFGFTNCQMTCPATLGKLTAVLDTMGKQAGLARVLFVSVDPNRDTPAALASFTKDFAPQVIGLTGTNNQLRALTKRYRVAFSYGNGYPDGYYAVYHSSAVFVFDGK